MSPHASCHGPSLGARSMRRLKRPSIRWAELARTFTPVRVPSSITTPAWLHGRGSSGTEARPENRNSPRSNKEKNRAIRPHHALVRGAVIGRFAEGWGLTSEGDLGCSICFSASPNHLTARPGQRFSGPPARCHLVEGSRWPYDATSIEYLRRASPRVAKQFPGCPIS